MMVHMVISVSVSVDEINSLDLTFLEVFLMISLLESTLWNYMEWERGKDGFSVKNWDTFHLQGSIVLSDSLLIPKTWHSLWFSLQINYFSILCLSAWVPHFLECTFCTFTHISKPHRPLLIIPIIPWTYLSLKHYICTSWHSPYLSSTFICVNTLLMSGSPIRM